MSKGTWLLREQIYHICNAGLMNELNDGGTDEATFEKISSCAPH
jgi:hypothetical protein